MANALAERLVAEAARYERAASKLREAAEILNEMEDTGPPVAAEFLRPRTHGRRLEQLKAIIRENGPMTRSEVLEKTQLPIGTVSSLLTRENFSRTDDGKWFVSEEK